MLAKMQVLCAAVLLLYIFLAFGSGDSKVLQPSTTNSGSDNYKLAATNRIVNGRDAKIQDFPYQLSLRRKSIHICGASVLAANWAITAAHCVYGFERFPDTFSLRMGSSLRSLGGAITAVKTIYRHPTYNSETMNFDVALIRTNVNALRGDYVQPIKLPEIAEAIPDDEPVVVSGWGHMSSSNHVLSDTLKYTTVYTVSQEECLELMEDQGGVTEAMFCAAAHRTDACQGDSGGPIALNHTLLGLVSWGVGCATEFPGVYTRLAYPAIRRWIHLLTRL